MKLSNHIYLFARGVIALGVVALYATGCGLLPNNSAQPTRAATQTPFIVFVPVTTTPEPATVTPLATVTSSAPPAATRTATRAVVARATATRTKTAAPVAVGPSATAAPACAFPPPTILDPNDGAQRTTFETRPGSDTFIFRWDPPPGVGGDDIGYKIQMDARTLAGKSITSDTVYISHNKFMTESQKKQFVYDAQRVQYMKQGGEGSTVTWYLSVVKFTGNIDDLGHLGGTASECSGSQTPRRSINLVVLG